MARLHLMLSLLCILCFSGCSHSRFDPAIEGQKLLQRDAEWSQAASEGKNLEKILSYWSDDAQVLEPGQPVYHGKAAIRRFVSDSLQTPGFHIHWVSQEPVFSPDGKMAYMRGTDEMTIPDSKGTPATVHMRGISIWRHDPDGEWRCVVDIANEAPQS
jgi:ketosteroid isomerase-like protein